MPLQSKVVAFLWYDPPFTAAPHNSLVVVLDKDADGILPRVLIDHRKMWGANLDTSELCIAVFITNAHMFDHVCARLRGGSGDSRGPARQVVELETMSASEEMEFLDVYRNGAYNRLTLKVDRLQTRLSYAYKPTPPADRYLKYPTILCFDFVPSVVLVPGTLDSIDRSPRDRLSAYQNTRPRVSQDNNFASTSGFAGLAHPYDEEVGSEEEYQSSGSGSGIPVTTRFVVDPDGVTTVVNTDDDDD
ncbi:hypothetical protein EUX98_g9206 [Antrodiella citrinella]|uniref:Uncharacterized protein n=1 Tax=Antrodiella citrinella TaxID=2447956 RepID=A0A4V3XFC2_9APHY|nr:hypothetical protein EUX98_g9206 [Antrodiella citrinella]